MKTYISISIGPLFETMAKAQKTRELWASSYFFSYFMRELTKKLRKANFNILIPRKDELDTPNFLGAGIYHDRIIVEANEIPKPIESVQKVMNDVVDDIATKMEEDFTKLDGKKIGKEAVFIKSEELEKDKIASFLKDYIKLNGNTIDIKDNDKKINIIQELSSLADIADKQPKIMPNDVKYEKNPLQQLFYLANWSFLFEDAFQRTYTITQTKNGKKGSHGWKDLDKIKKMPEFKLVNENPKRGFDSLIEIASRDLRAKDKDNYDAIINSHFENLDNDASSEEEDIITSLKNKFGKSFQDYHKYIAIVHSDGDNVGKIVNMIGKVETEISHFSNALIKYTKNCTEIIYENGGAPIFCGGDDLMFIAPVIYGEHNIFDLIEKLEKKFEDDVAKEYRGKLETFYKENDTPVSEQKFPSISYGVSITYYKFPLYEAKMMSYDLLKEIKASDEKNRILVKFMKHSGQTIPLNIKKEEQNKVELFNETTQFIKAQNSNKEFLNSFTYRIEQLKPLLLACLLDSEPDKKLHNFFYNFFNENYTKNKNFYDALIYYLKKVKEYYKTIDQKNIDSILKEFYGCLRFIHFTNKK